MTDVATIASGLPPMPVLLGFDPATEEMTRECFADDVARTLWLLWRPWHLVSGEFGSACLEVAIDIRRAAPKTAQELEACFGRSFDRRHHDFQDIHLASFCELALPYFTGEKQATFEVRI